MDPMLEENESKLSAPNSKESGSTIKIEGTTDAITVTEASRYVLLVPQLIYCQLLKLSV